MQPESVGHDARGDGCLGGQASLTFPQNVAVDAAGSLLIGDSYGSRVRRVLGAGVQPQSGSIPWQPTSSGGAGSGSLGGGQSLAIDVADGHADLGLPAISLPFFRWTKSNPE